MELQTTIDSVDCEFESQKNWEQYFKINDIPLDENTSIILMSVGRSIIYFYQ